MKGVGLVVAKGPNCRSQIGNVVGYMKFGAFAEYTVIYCQWNSTAVLSKSEVYFILGRS